MKDTGVQDLSPESCNKPSGDIFVFRYLFCRKKAWYTEQNNLEFVEENPMEEKTYRTRCGTIHYWASVSNLNLCQPLVNNFFQSKKKIAMIKDEHCRKM